MFVKNKNSAEGTGQTRVMNWKQELGGLMMKKKLLAVTLIFVAAGAAMAADVINVDIKGYGDNTPYIGNGAYDVGSNAVWTPYYGGWGFPVGSARTEGLQTEEQSFFCSVYASQVFVGDNGLNHSYQYGSGLMNNGFIATAGQEPNLAIFGDGAFQGIYDIYVYGNADGDFILGYYGTRTSQHVTGGIADGTFTLGGNYVVFTNVDCNDPYSGSIYIGYTGRLSAMQFVRKKDPVAIKDGTTIWTGKYDVAGERNIRTDDPQGYGPDLVGAEPNISVGGLEVQEFMSYDITVDDANQGRYLFSVDVNCGTTPYRINPLRIFLDNKFVGDICDMNAGETKTTDAAINLYKGNHTIQWFLPYQGFGSSTGSNLLRLKFTRKGSITMTDCNEVGTYGFNYPTDLSGDCYVNYYDLALAADNWMICNDPDPTKCF